MLVSLYYSNLNDMVIDLIGAGKLTVEIQRLFYAIATWALPTYSFFSSVPKPPLKYTHTHADDRWRNYKVFSTWCVFFFY